MSTPSNNVNTHSSQSIASPVGYHSPSQRQSKHQHFSFFKSPFDDDDDVETNFSISCKRIQSQEESYITTYPSLNHRLQHLSFAPRNYNFNFFTISGTALSQLLSNRVVQAHFEITPTTSLGNLPLVYSVPPPEMVNRFLNTPINVDNDRLTFCLLVRMAFIHSGISTPSLTLVILAPSSNKSSAMSCQLLHMARARGV